MKESAQEKSLKRFNPTQAKVQMAIAHYLVGPYHRFYNRLIVEGKEHVPEKGPFLIVSNHMSYFDPTIVVVSVDRPTGFVAKAELFKKPLLKPLINFLGALEIDRDKPSLSSIKTIKRVLKAGWAVGIFIEGTRNKTPGVLGSPHLGPAYLAWSTKVKILPAGLLDTGKEARKAIVRFGPTIEPSADLEATTWKIMESISKLIDWKLPERPAGDQEKNSSSNQPKLS